MSTATPPIHVLEQPSRKNAKAHYRRASLDGANDLKSLHESSKHLQNLRESHDDDEEEDSDVSSVSASSRDSQRRHGKHTRSKPPRTVRSRHSGSQSSLSSNGESYLPTLGRILEGRSSRDTPSRSTASSARNRSKTRAQAKQSSRNGRVTRQHTNSHTELQTRARSLTSPSMQSVLSCLTAATSSSSGSNGSNSTVTQSSYTRSESSKKSTLSSEHMPQNGQDTHKKRRRRKERQEHGQPDVFAFMEEDPTGSEGTASESGSEAGDEAAPRPQTPAMEAHRSSADPFVSPKPLRVASWASADQLHSDSGISVRGSSPESVGWRASDKQLVIPAADEDPKAKTKTDTKTEAKTEGTSAAARDHIETASSWQRRWSSASGGSVHPSAYLNSQGYPPTTMVPYAHPAPVHPRQVAQQPRKPSGYDLLASSVSDHTRTEDGKISGLYRRFGRLNHRILLHLQDEIAEMEEQLQTLDASLARCKASPSIPESRRIEARYSNDLTYQRTDLLGRIFVKIKQYNDALSSYNAVVKRTPPAGNEDIEHYRNFVKKVKPVAAEELRFLDCSDDLINTSGSASQPPSVPPPPSFRPITTMPSLLLGPPAAMLVAFVMFSAASSWLVRAVLLAVFSGAGYVGMYLTGFGKDMMADQERQVCLGFYVCLLACIAATAG